MIDYIINILKGIFNNEGIGQEPVEVKEEKPKVDLRAMTKKQLEAHGRSLGIELDRRHSKKKLIARLESVQ